MLVPIVVNALWHFPSPALRAGPWMLLAYLALKSVPAVAGGSSERVVIDRLTTDGVDYMLVVTPAPSQSSVSDLFLGSCARFEVHGTYRWLKGAIWGQEQPQSRKGHLEALEYLRQSLLAKRWVDFGWVGTGFVPVDPKDPCVVKSRALWLFSDERGTHILSFYTFTNARSD
jgi:hypothetical protein